MSHAPTPYCENAADESDVHTYTYNTYSCTCTPIHTRTDLNILYIDELPTLEELLILKYPDEGKRQKLRIIEEASHKWKDIASLISGDVNVTKILKEIYGSDPKECLKQIFIDYFINKKPQGYTQDWNGLIELLDDINLQTLAEKVKHAHLCAR